MTKVMVVNTQRVGPGEHWFLAFLETLWAESPDVDMAPTQMISPTVGMAPGSPTQRPRPSTKNKGRSPNNDHMEGIMERPKGSARVQPKALKELFFS